MSSQMQVSVIDWRTKSFGDIEPPRHGEPGRNDCKSSMRGTSTENNQNSDELTLQSKIHHDILLKLLNSLR